MDLRNYALSFAHAIIKVDDRQFVGVQGVNVNQELQEAAIYGTDMRPLKRTVGQLQLGRGQLTFSDFEEGTDFFLYLGSQPFLKIWTLDYALTREDGTTRSVECQGCRLTAVGIEHENAADGLTISYPFSFMNMKIDGVDLAVSPRGLAQAAIGVAQQIVNLI